MAFILAISTSKIDFSIVYLGRTFQVLVKCTHVGLLKYKVLLPASDMKNPWEKYFILSAILNLNVSLGMD